MSTSNSKLQRSKPIPAREAANNAPLLAEAPIAEPAAALGMNVDTSLQYPHATPAPSAQGEKLPYYLVY